MASLSNESDSSMPPAAGEQRKRRRSQDESESVMPQNTITSKQAKRSYSQGGQQKKLRVAKFSGSRGGSGHGKTQRHARIPQQKSPSPNEGGRHLSRCLQDKPSSSRKRHRSHDLNAASDSGPSQKRMKHEHASTSEGLSRHSKPRIHSPLPKDVPPNQAHSPGSWPQERVFDKSWKSSMVSMSEYEICSMAKWPMEELVKKLSYNIKAFQYTLSNKSHLDKPGIMDAIIKILSEVACCLTSSMHDLRKEGLQILTEAISDRCAAFQLQLKIYVRNDHPRQKSGQSSIQKIQGLYKLFYVLLRALPASSKSWLPVEDLKSAIDQLPNSDIKTDLLKDMEALSSHVDIESEKQWKRSHPGDTNYREMDIIPSWKEVCTPQKPQLRENIVVGGYCSWLDYYDTQFRLLREDFIAPVRKGICEYLEGGSGRKSGNIRVYKKVLLQEPMLYTPYGVCYKIKIAHLGNKIDWVHSKRLLCGSLLCLTPEHDNFKENIFFATIVNRAKGIAKRELVIQFKKNAKVLSFSCKDTSFIMIESCALFEASQHFLRALQTAEVDTMPFTEYLVEANVSSVVQPRYFAMSPESEYNLSSLLTEEAKNVIQENSQSDGKVVRDAKRKKVIPRNRCFLAEEVTDFKQWPSCEQTGLDASQLKGIHMALTQEIAVIQGPPGTGKTHIGLKIVEALLNNSRIHNRRGSRAPILVMCYTNHALDQFLEGILKSPVYKNVAPKLIRVGGRSKSEELAKFNLVEVRKNVFIPKQVRHDKKLIERAVKKFRSPETEAFLSATNSCVTFPLKVLEKVMHPNHHYQLFELQKTHRQSYCVLEMWLGLDTSNSHCNEIVDSAISKFEQEESPQAICKGTSEVGKKTNEDYQSEFLAEEVEEMTTELSHGDEFRSDYAHRKEFTCNPESDFSVYRCCVSFDRETIIKYGFSLAPMSEEDSRSVPDIHNLSFEGRWRLYQFWHSQHLKHLHEKCEREFMKYEDLCSKQTAKHFGPPAIEEFLSATNSCVTFPLKVLEKVMHPNHRHQLFELQKTHRQLHCVLAMWLGLDTSNSHCNEIVDSAILKFKQETSPQGNYYNGRESWKKRDEYQPEILVEEVEEFTTEQSHGDEYRSDCACRKEITYHSESDFRAIYRNCMNFNEERALSILRYGFSLAPMSEEDSRSVPDIHNLSFEDRWRLYQFWHSLHLKHLREKCETEFLKYENLCLKQANVRRTADLYALETASIIGMTTTGAAKHQRILRCVKPKIVIVEEAAEVLESHIVSALDANTQHLILIGDHKQLRPKPNEYELTKKYQFDVSLFERLVRNGFPRATLECQHRMRPEIAELVKPHIYSELSNHSSVKEYPDVRGISTNLFFINHKFPEEEDQNLASHSNEHEAKYLVGLCQYILQQQQYSPENITILVTYTGQQRMVRRLIFEKKIEGVRVDTVDNFQGEENNIILLSLVRSNSEKIVGFLKEENRVCVALSRAQHGFYCIGNFDMLRQTVPLWERIVADVEGKGRLGEGLSLHCSNHSEKKFVAKSSEDFEKYSPEGGCLLDCNFRLECGHTCTLKCHFTDPEHVGYKCNKKCIKLCPQGHPCCKLCFVPCGECEVRLTKVMPHCQHEQELPCWKDPSNVDCNSLCENKCPKGHRCPRPCHQKSQENCPPCVVKVPFIVPSCQHKQLVECHQDTAEILCRAKCSHECPQGHQCRKLCHDVCGECMEPVLKVLEVCNHEINLPCHVEPIHSECTKPCEKVLQCGHKCHLKCGEDCSACLCVEVVTAEFPDCGHEIQVPCHMSHDLSRISDVAPIQCEVLVTQEWPCGHTLRRPCYQRAAPEDYPCKVSVTKELACGHPCTKRCWEAFDDECQSTCNQVLSCGHKCKGQCSQCTNEHVHKLCPFKTEVKRFCGHSLEISCSGLMDEHPCDQGIPITCFHRSRRVMCSDEVLHRCRSKCLWRCPHFKCSKLCYEMCNRPKCDKHCRKRLRCGHPCFSLCGEPCLTPCPLCESKLFEEKLCVGKFSKSTTYYKLDCKHIFPVKYLDEYVHQLTNSRSHVLVCPVQCPVKECSQPFNRSYRYGNDVKRLLPYIQDIHALVSVNYKKNSKDRELLCSRLDCLLSNITTSSIVSGCLSRTACSVLLSVDEKYTIFILAEVINIFEILCQQSPFTGIVAYYKKTMEETKCFLKKLSEIYKPWDYPPLELTYQFVNDLQREFFRLYLKVYILLVKTRVNSALSGVNSHHRVGSQESVPLTPPSLVDTCSRIDSSSLSLPTQALNLEATSESESGELVDSEDPSLDTGPLTDACLSVEQGFPSQESISDTESGELVDSEDEKSPILDTGQELNQESTSDTELGELIDSEPSHDTGPLRLSVKRGLPTQELKSTSDTESGELVDSEDEKSPSLDTGRCTDTRWNIDPGILSSPMQASNLESISDTESGELSNSEDASHDTGPGSFSLNADFPQSTLAASDGLPSMKSDDKLDNSASLSVCEDRLVPSDEDLSAFMGIPKSPMLPDQLQTRSSCDKDVLKIVEVESAIVAAEEFLKEVPLKVTKSDITAHCEAMGKLFVLDYKRMLKGMDRFYPVVQKGQWWRCPSTKEYYCLPPSSSADGDKEMKCPNCNGKEL